MPPQQRPAARVVSSRSSSSDSQSNRVITQEEWSMDDEDLPTSMENDHEKPCTITITQHVDADKIDSFREWQDGILKDNRVSRGFLGATIIREDHPGKCVFAVILRYDCIENARRWNRSVERDAWIDRLKTITKNGNSGEAQISFDDIPVFDNLFRSGAKSGFWRKRRMWLLIWLQVFGLVELYGYLLPRAVGDTLWFGLNLHVRILVSTLLSTLTIDVLTMDIVVRIGKYIGFL